MTDFDRFHDDAPARNVPECPWLESAALYATGALSVADARPFEEHLARGCGACAEELAGHEATLAQLDRLAAEEVLAREPSLAPPDSVRRELLARIGEAAGTDAAEREPALDRTWQKWSSAPVARSESGLTTVTASEQGWESIGVPGIDVRKLSVDPVRRLATMLVRMAPGTQYPPHRHAAREECFVVSGAVEVAGRKLRAGDYQVADEGSTHGVQTTDEGCLLFIVSSQDDELV